MPGPGEYKTIIAMSPSAIGGFSKSKRKTFFDDAEKSSEKMPGPATYD